MDALRFLPDKPYQADEDDVSCLLVETCAEQRGRLHVLALLSAYLARPLTGPKRQLLENEVKNLWELIEAVWCELGCAFPNRFVQAARMMVEHEVAPQVQAGGNAPCEQTLLF